MANIVTVDHPTRCFTPLLLYALKSELANVGRNFAVHDSFHARFALLQRQLALYVETRGAVTCTAAVAVEAIGEQKEVALDCDLCE